MFRKLKKKINILLVLGRYNYPTGAFLLMWPCFWGVLYNPNFESDYLLTLFLLFIGSFVMRGAGCCINDFFDQDLDKKVPICLNGTSIQINIEPIQEIKKC